MVQQLINLAEMYDKRRQRMENAERSYRLLHGFFGGCTNSVIRNWYGSYNLARMYGIGAAAINGGGCGLVVLLNNKIQPLKFFLWLSNFCGQYNGSSKMVNS
jgi:hypothetical protein